MPKVKVKKDTPDGGRDSLDILRVIRRLEVGPVRLDRNRVTAPYMVTQNDKTDTIELVFRFEENVFVPEDGQSMNLAGMLSAQVALNYGLFCHEIIFHGPFDRDDQRFIKEMAANTAREIFVKKFLEPNPFLLKHVSNLSPTRHESYLGARLLFPDEQVPAPGKVRSHCRSAVHWQVDPSKHAVLSSGGKDSLLSFGLLKEMGREVHPVFVNESGRHWFTALNAYRHFADHIPTTARVWTNADRVFNWMLRHLPFVRQDFEKIRSDAYPIRLWTVALFIFGAFPLLKKRGIGRLIIGDEFDTTQRLSFGGISHYDGLYDQSRYFDNTLARYFHKKGWGISQFSLLRPLSEILVEKILIERYPELQRHQVSCHSGHKKDKHVLPCGDCEKCRRIVGILIAIGGDPTLCGYHGQQINRCLKNLPKKGLHQETEAVQHLAFLLKEKGLISDSFIGAVRARERPEILKLRFDRQKSPVEGIPLDLRRPLYRIYLEHADGVVKRRGRTWLEYDVLNDAALQRPYPFESPGKVSFNELSGGDRRPEPSSSPILGKLTWPEAKKRLEMVDVALLPVGSIEQHGPHLPLDTDAFDAEYLARRVAQACKEPRPVVLPLIPYGVSYHHEDFSGTISVNPDTLSQFVYDIGMSAARQGIVKLVVINGHGGNSPALHFAAQMINRDAHIFTCVDTGETSDPDIHAMAESPNDIHAGEIETSTTLAVRPEEVRLKAARKSVPRFPSRYLDFTSKRGVTWYVHTAKISSSGVLGDPTKATAEKGKRMWDQMIKHLVEFVEDLKSVSLDGLYQRRY